MISSRRRAESPWSICLDYSTCHRIDEDILWRFQACLLPRMQHLSSRTPWTLDTAAFDSNHDVSCFDFATAKSVAKIILLELPTPGLPLIQINSTKYMSYLKDSVPRMNKRPEDRSSISTTDLQVSDQLYSFPESTGSQLLEDAAFHDTLFTCCPPFLPEEGKRPIKLPRMVLQDKVPRRKSSVPKKSRTRSVTEAKMGRRSEALKSAIAEKKDASRVYEFEVSSALAKLSPKLRGVKVQSPCVVLGYGQQRPSEHVDNYLRPNNDHIPGNYEPGISHDGNDGITDSPVPCDEALPPQVDILPAQDSTPVILCSLTDPGIRSAQSVASLGSDLKPASLLSGASRTSVYRHALLKPSISPLLPLDMGLPVQPVLTSQPITCLSIDDSDMVSKPANDSTQVIVTPTAALAEALRASQGNNYAPGPPPVTVAEGCRDREHDTGAKTSAPLLLLDEKNRGSVMVSQIAEYWGFHPELMDSVESAVKAAVRNAVHHAGLSPKTDHHDVCRAYRRLIAESLAEAARTADKFLERSSTWNSPTPGRSRDSFPNTLCDEQNILLDMCAHADVQNRQIHEGVLYHTRESSLIRHRPVDATEAEENDPEAVKRENGVNSPLYSIDSGRDLVPELRRASSMTPAISREDNVPRRSSSLSPLRRPRSTDSESTGLRRTHHRHHWLRELVTKGETYSPKLTTIPPRMYRRLHGQTHQQTEKATVTVFGGDIENPHTDSTGPQASETFMSTINDLEHLLNEALNMARLAAETDYRRGPANLGEDVAVVLQKGRRSFSHSANTSQAIRFDASSTVASVHENLHNISDYSALDESMEMKNELKNTATQYPPPSLPAKTDNLHMVVPSEPYSPPTDIVHAQVQSSTQIGRTSTPGKLARLALRKEIIDPRHLSPIRRHTHLAGPEDQQRPQAIRSLPINEPGLPPKDFKRPKKSVSCQEDSLHHIRVKLPPCETRNKRQIREFIRVYQHPPIEPRQSSLTLRKSNRNFCQAGSTEVGANLAYRNEELDHCSRSTRHSLDGPHETESEIDFTTPHGIVSHVGMTVDDPHTMRIELKDANILSESPKRHISGRRLYRHGGHNLFSLRGKHHVSIDHHHGFSLSRSHKRQPVARDWSPSRKRFVAAVACVSTALIGILIGIYAGEVPSIQYYIADFHHFAILGNIFMFIGLALSTFFCWPLPLLHGRKPYVLGAMTIAMPLLFPQAIVVSRQRDPYTPLYRIGLILPRACMGFVLGFANMNSMATLTDLFGASLQSGNPHQEIVDEHDVRRHGGGMGLWLGIWTWCYMGSIGVGFLIGSWIINELSPDWGFYVSIIIIAAVLLLNVITPEVRRSAYRRSVAEVRNGHKVSRRLAKGEVMMHRLQTGPHWWGEEFHQGVMLSCDMLRQPGFGLMALYVAWIYGQIVLVIVLLGSLMSRYYHFTSPFVGLTTMAIPVGAMLAVPFQKASLFSRARHHPQRTDSMTFERRITWTSHLLRRAIFTLVLPFAGMAYTLSSSGPPTPFVLPILFAGLIGFLSNLAIAECNGIIMEAFDTSDLQPGMTGRPRGASGEATRHKRTNYSSFPRVSSAFAITQSLGFLIAAAATGVGGVAQRHLGQQAATGVMAGILLILTFGVLCVLIRWKDVQIIPSSRTGDMERWRRSRKESVLAATGKSVKAPISTKLSYRSGDGVCTPPESQVVPWEEEPWRPVIIGNPSGKTRRMSILELGHLSRWSEIRRRNRLIDEDGYEAKYPNLAVVESVKERVREGNLGSLRRGRRGNKSGESGNRSGTETGTD